VEELCTLKKRVDGHDVDISDLRGRTSRLASAVYGDSEQEYNGLLTRTRNMEEVVTGLVEERAEWGVRWDTMEKMIRLGAWLLALIAAGDFVALIGKALIALGG
jgi:hypothetical protein